MPDVTYKKFEDLDAYQGTGRRQFLYAGKSVGVTAWKMNVLDLPPNWDGYPDHDHAKDGQEEAYVTLKGSAELTADGESWSLTPGTIVRVGAHQKRKITPGPEGATILAIGGTPPA